jgi:biotin operon repressor
MPRRPPPAPPKGTKFGGPPRRRNLTLIRATIAAGIKSGQFQHRPGTYALVPLAPLFDPELGSRKRDLLLLLCRYRDAETGQCNPSQGRLARDLGIKRRAVQKLLMELEERGHIMTDLVHQKHGGQTSSQYWIRFAHPPASLSDAPPCVPVGRTPCVPDGRTPCVPDGRTPCVPVGRTPCVPVGRTPCVPVGRTPCVPDGRTIRLFNQILSIRAPPAAADRRWQGPLTREAGCGRERR